MVGRFFRASFYTFSGSRDTTLRKRTPLGVFFSAVFSNSLNMKRRRVLPLSSSLKLHDIGFCRNDIPQAYVIPVKLVKNNRGTCQKWWGKWNGNRSRVGSMSLLNMALLCLVSGWDHLILFFASLRGFGLSYFDLSSARCLVSMTSAHLMSKILPHPLSCRRYVQEKLTSALQSYNLPLTPHILLIHHNNLPLSRVDDVGNIMAHLRSKSPPVDFSSLSRTVT